MSKWTQQEMGGFYVGQRVRLSAEGRSQWRKDFRYRSGTVAGTQDLSSIIPSNDRYGALDFALKVKMDGSAKLSFITGNGRYFEPVPAQEAEAA